MKRNKFLQSPFTPLIFLILIMSGYMFGARVQKTQEPDSGSSQEVMKEQSTQDAAATAAPTQVNEPDEAAEVDTRTNAEIALENGSNLGQEITDEYAKDVLDLYCSRKVVECNSKNMVRTNESNMFQQSFDEMTGYMELVKLSVSKETVSELKVSTKLKDVTVMLIFPDHTYVQIDCNQSVSCPLPAGNTMLLYIGDHLKGSIQADVKENKAITCKRM